MSLAPSDSSSESDPKCTSSSMLLLLLLQLSSTSGLPDSQTPVISPVPVAAAVAAKGELLMLPSPCLICTPEQLADAAGRCGSAQSLSARQSCDPDAGCMTDPGMVDADKMLPPAVVACQCAGAAASSSLLSSPRPVSRHSPERWYQS